MESVLHLLSGDESEQKAALTIAQNLVDDQSGDIDDVAIVAQSEGIEAVTTDGEYSDQVQSLLSEGVNIKACRNTLEAMGMDESALVDGIDTVPEGAVEVTRLESDGYAYMRP